MRVMMVKMETKEKMLKLQAVKKEKKELSRKWEIF